MKITKGRFQQILKEEVNKFLKSSKIEEVSSYVMSAYEKVVSSLGADDFLLQLMKRMSDAEALSKIKEIAKENNIPLESGNDQEQPIMDEEILNKLEGKK